MSSFFRLLTASVLQVDRSRVFFVINGVLVHILHHQLFGGRVHVGGHERGQVEGGGPVKLSYAIVQARIQYDEYRRSGYFHAGGTMRLTSSSSWTSW